MNREEKKEREEISENEELELESDEMHSEEETEESAEKNEGDAAVIEQLRVELNKMNDKYLRLLAEFDNFRRRTARDQLELRKTASKDIMADLLPVLDDFDRALKIIEKGEGSDSVIEGFKLVYQKFYKTLESRGLEVMESDGKSFDAEMHEAITEVPAPSKKMKGKVIDTVEKGYLLNEKIIRYAKVVVGK